MKKKFAAWLLVLCMLIGVLSACGSTAAPASSAAAPESAAEEAAEAPAQEEAEAPETVAAAPETEGSAVSAVGATLGDEFFTAKADTTVTSIACFNMNLYEIYKFQLSHLLPYTTMK